jgi:hypothetical protein
MATELKMTLLLRRAEFADSCKLQLGEPGYHTGTKEFKIGDGQTTWKELPVANETQIKGWISALKTELEGKIATDLSSYYTKTQVDDLLEALQGAIDGVSGQLGAEVTARENADTQIRTDFAAADASTLAEAKGYADTKKAEVVGTSADAKTVDTVYGAKAFATDAAATAKSEAISAAAEDAASKANAAEAAAKSHAEAKASAAQAAAEATAESKDVARAQAAATALSEAKTELEGKISSGDSATLASAKAYTDEQVAAETLARGNADTALDNKITALRNEIGNLANVMNFRGAVDAETDITDPVEGDVITIKGTGVEKVYSAGAWIEIGTASASDAAIAALQERMDAAEEDIDQTQADILALGTNKMDKSAFTTWEQGFEADKLAHENDHAKKQTEITADIATAKSEAIIEAGKLDTALHTEISKEIDDDVKAAIDAEVTRSNAYADKAEEDAIATAASQADAKDATLHTTITGEIATAKSEAISTAAGDATTKANAAEAAAKSYADTKKAEAIEAAAADATAKADAAEAKAKAYADAEIAKEKKRAEDEEAAIRSEFAAADVTTLTSAQTYADTVAANAVKNNIKSGNDDIVVTRPDSGDDAGKTVISHKVYGSGTYTKPDSVNDANFVTGVTIENGHVTGASVKSLAEALEAMTFIFDGGTSATTVE